MKTEAINNENEEIVKLLLDNNANPNLGLQLAIDKEYVEIVKLLSDYGAAVDFNKYS